MHHYKQPRYSGGLLMSLIYEMFQNFEIDIIIVFLILVMSILLKSDEVFECAGDVYVEGGG